MQPGAQTRHRVVSLRGSEEVRARACDRLVRRQQHCYSERKEEVGGSGPMGKGKKLSRGLLAGERAPFLQEGQFWLAQG